MRLHLIAAATCFACASAPALAAQASPWYYGAGLGSYRPDVTAGKSAWGVLGRGGYALPWGKGFSVEGELGLSLSAGKWAYRDLRVSHAAAYAVWRSPGEVYVKLRAGGLYEHVRVGDGSATDPGASLGAGVGWTTDYGRFELEYTVIENHIELISLVWGP